MRSGIAARGGESENPDERLFQDTLSLLAWYDSAGYVEGNGGREGE